MFRKADKEKSKCKGSETKQVSPAGKQKAGREIQAYKVKLERRSTRSCRALRGLTEYLSHSTGKHRQTLCPSLEPVNLANIIPKVKVTILSLIIH